MPLRKAEVRGVARRDELSADNWESFGYAIASYRMINH